MENEITLAYVQEMVRRKEGRLGEKQQILRLMDAVGRLAHAIDREEGMEEAYGIDMEDCIPGSVPMPAQEKKPPRNLDFRPL